MKARWALLSLGGVIILAGCYDPPVSYDVRGNGQGGVNITEVPKRPNPNPPPPPPPPTIVYVPVPETQPMMTMVPGTEPTPVPVLVVPATNDVQKVTPADDEALKAQIRALEAENARLRQQIPTTQPATSP